MLFFLVFQNCQFIAIQNTCMNLDKNFLHVWQNCGQNIVELQTKKIINISKNVYFWHFHFTAKFVFLAFRFYSKICIFGISILQQNLYLWPKFRFLTKISIFDQNFDFLPKFRFLTKILNFLPVWQNGGLEKQKNTWEKCLFLDFRFSITFFSVWRFFFHNIYLIYVSPYQYLKLAGW